MHASKQFHLINFQITPQVSSRGLWIRGKPVRKILTESASFRVKERSFSASKPPRTLNFSSLRSVLFNFIVNDLFAFSLGMCQGLLLQGRPIEKLRGQVRRPLRLLIDERHTMTIRNSYMATWCTCARCVSHPRVSKYPIVYAIL